MEKKKDNRGKARKFKTQEEFKEQFIQYINECKHNQELANIAGFCVFCDMHRDTFYEQNKFYPDTLKRRQDILENATINAKINDTFKIFYLKNKFGYKDKQENVNIETSYEDYIKQVEGEEY